MTRRDRDGHLAVAERPRCAEPVLTGTLRGLRVVLDRHTVPPAEATVLHRWGVTVLQATVTRTAVLVTVPVPGVRLTGPRYLLAQHVCGHPMMRHAPESDISSL